MATLKISEELHDTVDQLDHIKEVYFTKTGAHYFNQHELKEGNKGTGKFYGSLLMEQKFTHSEGDRKFYKMVNKANPVALIVKTLTREEIFALYDKQNAALSEKKLATA